MSDEQNERSPYTSVLNPEGSASLDESDWEQYFPTTPSFPTPAPRPRPSLLRTRSSSTASRPHIRSRDPVQN